MKSERSLSYMNGAEYCCTNNDTDNNNNTNDVNLSNYIDSYHP